MTKTSVGRARKNIKAKAKLTNPPKPLKIDCVNNAVFTTCQMNITMDVVEDVFPVDLSHPIDSSEECFHLLSHKCRDHQWHSHRYPDLHSPKDKSSECPNMYSRGS